jgi:hypothetical protein
LFGLWGRGSSFSLSCQEGAVSLLWVWDWNQAPLGADPRLGHQAQSEFFRHCLACVSKGQSGRTFSFFIVQAFPQCPSDTRVSGTLAALAVLTIGINGHRHRCTNSAGF